MKLTDGTFGDVVFRPGTAVLVEFWSPASGRAGAEERLAVLERLALVHSDSVRVMRLDVEDNPVAALVYGVRRVPLTILFRGGEEIGRWDQTARLEDIVSRLADGGSSR